MYEPTKLAQAVEQIKKQREDRINAMANQAEKSEGECAALFDKLGTKPAKELRGIGYCLSDYEKSLLAKYMFKKVEDAGKDPDAVKAASDLVAKYSVILTEEMNEDMTVALYTGCQQYYGSEAMNPLYTALSDSKEFTDMFTSKYRMDGKKIMKAFCENTIGELMNKEASAKSNMGYAQALEAVGVIRDTMLYKRCMVYFVVVCDTDDYRAIGPDELYNVASSFNDDMLLKLFANIVQRMDTVQLRRFVKLVELFINLVGDKGTDHYMKIMQTYGLDKIYQDRYNTWVNQYYVNKAFGENEVSEFWYSYAGKTEMSLHSSGVMLIKFNYFVVVESKQAETAYFYDREYFEKSVWKNIEDETEESEILEFLNTQTGFGGTGECANNWRKAHKGSWKFDVMDYINRHNRPQM